MEKINKNREERIEILRRAYKLLTDTSIIDFQNPENLRRARLFLPKSCIIDGVLREHSNVLSSLRKERLKDLLIITNTIPPPHYLTFEMKEKTKRNDDDCSTSSGDSVKSCDNVEDDELKNEEKGEKDAVLEKLKNFERLKLKNRLRPKVYKKTNLPTIQEETVYEECDLCFYIDLICNCLDVLMPFTNIDKDLKMYKENYAKK